MGAPAWTAKEISALEEMTAKYPLPTVARKLNRSVSAVFLKQQRLGIGGLRQNSDMITRNTLSKILGIENRTIKSWEEKGLKSIKKKPYIMYHVSASGHYLLHERTSGRLECGQDHR